MWPPESYNRLTSALLNPDSSMTSASKLRYANVTEGKVLNKMIGPNLALGKIGFHLVRWVPWPKGVGFRFILSTYKLKQTYNVPNWDTTRFWVHW